MKLLLGVLVAFGMAGWAAAQTTPQRPARLVYSGPTEVTANSITHDSTTRTTHARGAVRIVSGDSTITADEADLHHLLDTRAAVDFSIDLRGNVRVMVTPSASR